MSAASGAFGFSLTRLEGGELPLASFAGKPLLVVNTASKCGFTPQYAGLEALWNEHRDAGFSILGVPSNDFGKQEPGNAEEIGAFCQRNYGVSFPMAGKEVVSGSGAHPLFRWFAEQGGFWARPRWNFWKFLIAPDGRLAGAYSSLARPQGKTLEQAVSRLLSR
jgi:glutathione peroxidase